MIFKYDHLVSSTDIISLYSILFLTSNFLVFKIFDLYLNIRDRENDEIFFKFFYFFTWGQFWRF